VEIRIVDGEDDLRAVRTLFQEYWDSFGFTPCFQDFGAELASLPGKYALPRGRLAVARVDGAPAGCIALRPVDRSRCECKRLYVRRAFRSHRLGKSLLQWLIGEARSAGYSEMVCDTMPVMEQALAMYERMGFERTGPYVPDATEGAIYLRLKL